MLGGFNRVLHIVVELEKLSFDTLTNNSRSIPLFINKKKIIMYLHRIRHMLNLPIINILTVEYKEVLK